MTLLQQILSEMKTDDRTQQIRELCDKIQKEEESSNINKKYLPTGPNVFLALEVPGRMPKELAFLSLERESEELYLIVLSTILKAQLGNEKIGLKRQKVWEVGDNRPEKVLTQYAKTYKFLRGE